MKHRKRLFTNSMLNAWRKCKRKYRLTYIEELQRMRLRKPLYYGDLAHRLLELMYLGCSLEHIKKASEEWISAQVNEVGLSVKENDYFHIVDGVYSLIDETELEAKSIASDVMELIEYYFHAIYPAEKEKWEVVFSEQRFNVPFIDRNNCRHKTWRYAGKWDMVARDRASGRVIIIDHKTTSLDPVTEVGNLSLSTQPVAYTYAATYLSAIHRTGKEQYKLDVVSNEEYSINTDEPMWPLEIEVPHTFRLNVIRKKIPKKPEVLKKKGKGGTLLLSKSKGIDTTFDLYMEAIRDNGLNPDDYADVLRRLEKKPFNFCVSEEVPIGPDEIIRWVGETRAELEDILRVEKDLDHLATRNPSQCNVFGVCSYAPLCWGDEKQARALFRRVPAHSELGL